MSLPQIGLVGDSVASVHTDRYYRGKFAYQHPQRHRSHSAPFGLVSIYHASHLRKVPALRIESSGRRSKGERERYHITVITPPPRPLGIHPLSPNMQCGEMVEVQGEPFIVSGVTYRYHIRNGRYEPSERRLDVQGTGRYFLNLHLDTLLEDPRD